MRFLIMNGAGNRFAVFDARPDFGGHSSFVLSDEKVIEICKPGSTAMGPKGADQLIILRAPKQTGADIFMEIRNQQGFEVDACGNATRTTAWLHMRDTGTDSCVVETNDGLLLCARAGEMQISVDMGKPKLEWEQIPLKE
ncbi:MAG: diaminopimelate epimerase, partial [Litorimonas sp.]